MKGPEMTAAPPATDIKDTLEGMRASAAARGRRTGLRASIDDMILRILGMLLAMLADFRAGRLATPAAPPEEACRADRLSSAGEEDEEMRRRDCARTAARRGRFASAGGDCAGEEQRANGAGSSDGAAAARESVRLAPRVGTTARPRRRAGWRRARGMRRAVSRNRSIAGGDAGRFFKNGLQRAGSGAGMLFQDENDVGGVRR